MTTKLQVYKCEKCGNIIEVLHEGPGGLVCCGEPMVLLEAKAEDAGTEKHLPVVDVAGSEVKVKVGDVPHPMEDEHFIEWIEVVTKTGTCKRFLAPHTDPAADFMAVGDIVEVRSHCNVHGLWSKRM